MSSRHSRAAMIVACSLAPFAAIPNATPRFIAHDVASGLTGGYQVIAADLNRDGRPDLIALASGLPELAWFENPTWTRHVLASGLSGLINVAAADLDHDGIPEFAVAYGFSTRPDQSTGNVTLLTHGESVTSPWTVREIDRVPSAHRLRWFTAPNGEKWLINAPLAGETSQPPDYKGATPIYYYRAPQWKRELLTNEEQGVVHAIEPLRWEARSEQLLLSAGFVGIHQYTFDGQWRRALIAEGNPVPWPKSGASDIAIGHVDRERFIASIEPWHGNQVVVYRELGGTWSRQVLDSTVVDGHTLVVADFDGDGRDDIVVGQRGGTRSVWLFTLGTGVAWNRMTLDDGGMAAAGCTTVDLNGDGRIDLACIGTATANLKWYENVP